MISLVALALCVRVVFAGIAQGGAESQEHADRGMQAAQRGDLKSAEAELRQAVELAPQNPIYLGTLGAILGANQKLAESNLYLEKALEIIPNDFSTRRNLASNQFQLGQLQPAKVNLERILKVKPGDRTSVLLLGMVEEELKNYRDAIRLLASVREQVRQNPKSVAALARAYYHTGQREKARATLAGLKSLPAGPEGVFLGGQVAAEVNDFETAERMFASIWSTYPDTAELGYNLALTQYRAGRIQESQATLRRLIGARQENADIYNLLGWCLYKQDKFEEGIAAMDKAVALDPRKESNYLDVGMMMMGQHHFSGALAAAEKAVEVAPDSYRAYRLKGLAESELAKVIDAEKSFARALELNPNDPEAIRNLATAQWDDGKIQKAEATFQSGMRQFPQDARFYQDYGVMLLETAQPGDPATETRAVSMLQKALALNQSLAEPHYQLGNLALNKGRSEEALRQLERAAKLDPKSSKVHFSLGRAYRRLGRTAEAAKEVRIYKSLLEVEGKSASGASVGRRTSNIPDTRPTSEELQ